MLRAGCWVLTAWAVLNLIPSFVIVLNTLFRGGHTPALYSVLSEQEVEALSTETMATLDSIAVFANGTNIAFCLVVLGTVWLGLSRRQVWAFWALLAGFTAALAAGVAADFVVGTVLPEVNVISGAILALGFACAGFGLFRDKR